MVSQATPSATELYPLTELWVAQTDTYARMHSIIYIIMHTYIYMQTNIYTYIYYPMI